MSQSIVLRPLLHRTRSSWAIGLIASPALWATLSGCGDSGPKTYVVRGTISFQDKPVESGIINFFPTGGGKPLGGPFDDQGRFQFRLPAGEYQVIINAPARLPENWQEGDPLPQTTPRVPPKYAHPKRSGLSALISADNEPNVVDFPLR